MSTSVVAANKVKVYALNGKDDPVGLGDRRRGRAGDGFGRRLPAAVREERGRAAPIGGAGTEMGGHKGYGLGLFAQILAEHALRRLLLADPQPHAEALATPTISGTSSWR